MASPTTIQAWLRGERFPQQIDQVLKLTEGIQAAARACGIDEKDANPLVNDRRWRAAYSTEATRRAKNVAGATRAAYARKALARDLGPAAGHDDADGHDDDDAVPQPMAHLRAEQHLGAAEFHPERLRFRLPRVVAHFTGRDELLVQLHAALRKSGAGVVTQAISGLGGVGKTQLASAYVAAHHNEFDIAAWVRAEDGGIADLAELAVALALPMTGRSPRQRARDALMFLANTDRRWLLVLDNAHGPRALVGLPSSGHGRVLVTSRHRGGYEAFGAELAIDVFDIDTARQYLLARTGRTNREADDAQAVATALGGLPLALSHAGAYCNSHTGLTFGDYLQLLEGLPSQDLFDTNPEVFYQHTVAATWHTSITAAEHQAPLAAQVLAMAAHLDPEAIPRSFFSVLAENSAEGRKQVADAIAALHRYSLITVSDDRISVHRLLQKVIRDQLAEREQVSATAHALTAIERAMPADPGLQAAWPQWQELVRHVITIANIEAVANFHATQLISILNSTSEFLRSAGSPRQALVLADRAVSVSMACDHLGPHHPDTITAWDNLASSYWSAGRTDEAITIGERVVAERERMLGPDHPDTFIARDNLASWYLAAGRTDEAIDTGEWVVADRERILGSDHPDTLTALDNLAYIYQSAGRKDEAVAIEEQVVADRQRILGPDHPDTLINRGHLAFLYRITGRIDEAIVIEKQVVADSERVLGPDHHHTVDAKANLAMSEKMRDRNYPRSSGN